jgi:diguanylate cyclase (GGDEF)-like protein/PAS domain S-box-containing protein
MIYLLEFISWPVDINPFAFTLMSLIIYLGSKDQNILEIVPIARDTVFENIYDAVIVLDTKGIIVDYNRAAEYLLGKEKIIGTSIQSILKKYFDDNTVIDIANIDSFNEVTINNKVFNIRHISFTNKKGQNIGSAFILRDITEYKLLTQKLHELAVTDDLTGISNRRHFFDNASRELFRSKRASRPLSIIMFDIDHFKSVNDTYGHAVGDNVLKKIAARISSNLRSLDIYARYGGEEFIICLPETALEDAKNVAERIRGIVEETIMQDTNNNDFKVTVSLGVASLSHDSDALEQIIEQADKALYKAKQGGRNRVGV